MAATAPPAPSFAALDRLIAVAYADLRSARAGVGAARDRASADSGTRAEEHLNALLEYRHAVLRRCPPGS